MPALETYAPSATVTCDSDPYPYYGYLMQIHASAHRHGLNDDEIRHPWNNALGYFTVDADTDTDTEPPKR